MKLSTSSVFTVTRFAALAGACIGILYLLFIGLISWEYFTQPVDLIAMKREFAISKYVLGEQGANISDDVVYIVAGDAYLSGTLPTDLNFEHPPFVKYLYGLSSLWFKTPIVGSFFFFGIFVLSIIWLGLQHLRTWTSRGLFWLSIFLNPLFYEYATKAMLDLPQTSLALLGIASTQRFIVDTRARWIVLAGLVFGFALSAKYPFPLIALLILGATITMMFHSRKVLLGFLTLLLSGVVYLLTYLPVFLSGWSPIEFLRFEWWRFQWFLGKVSEQKGLLLQVVMVGEFVSPWEPNQVLRIEKYSVLWPISFVGFLIGVMVESMRSRFRSDTLLFWKFWTIFAFGIYMLGAAHDLYLVGLMPAFAFFTIRMLEPILSIVDTRMHIVLEKICR